MSTIDKLYVNGPINVVRLEGIINNIKKVIYVFFDYHSPLIYQTRCEDDSSISINK
jgi:hypothetical protein